MDQHPIVIVGGGIVGLSMGLFFKKYNIPFVIFDNHPQSDDIRTLFINRSNVHFLQSLGVKFDGTYVKSIVLEDRLQGISSCYDSYHPYISQMVIFKDFKCQLQSLVKDYIVHTDYNESLSLKNQLLIGADGVYSKIRQQAGIDVLKRDYQSVARVYHIEHSHRHEKKAYEIFHQDHIIATLPLKNPHHSGVVICSPVACTQEDHGNHLGISHITTPIKEYPLVGIFAQKVTCYEKHVILIGDAAHHYHPLAGQGLNVGLKDVINLGNIILKAHCYGIPFVSSSVFSAYESQSIHHTRMRIFIHGVLNGPTFLKKIGIITWPRWSYVLEGYI